MPSHQTAFGRIGVSCPSYFLFHHSYFSSTSNLPSLTSPQTLLRSLLRKHIVLLRRPPFPASRLSRPNAVRCSPPSDSALLLQQSWSPASGWLSPIHGSRVLPCPGTCLGFLVHTLPPPACLPAPLWPLFAASSEQVILGLLSPGSSSLLTLRPLCGELSPLWLQFPLCVEGCHQVPSAPCCQT